MNIQGGTARGGPGKTHPSKLEYERVRREVIRQIVRENAERYEMLMANRLGRPLESKARTLTKRVASGETRKEWEK